VSRPFKIQINVNDLGHELLGLSDADCASWLRGFHLGVNGKPLPAGHGASADCGHAFGTKAWQDTMDFMDRCKAAGEKSVAVRRAAGSAQPPKGVRQSTEGCSKGVRQITEPDTEQTSNHKPVINKQETSNLNTYGPSLPTRDGVGYRLPRSVVDQLVKAYPGADLDTELSKMAVWLAANPAKGKTARGMLRFINGWMGRVRGTPAVQVEQDDIPSESDWLACKEIAEACEAEKNSKTGAA